jgi:UDP-N-acetylglucosamine 2-epimerase (non-hydrolysing)
LKHKVAIVIGTRPEAIKLWPLIEILREDPLIEPTVISTGQHGSMISNMLSDLEIQPDVALANRIAPGSLSTLLSSLLVAIEEVLLENKPSIVVVQGDTASALAGTIAAFFARIPVAHVEAGLRTHDLKAPFPEEFNRQAIARVADLHFAPTNVAAANLIREGISPERVILTGNTVVDATIKMLQNIQSQKNKEKQSHLLESFGLEPLSEGNFAIVTLHRRENAGKHFETVLQGLRNTALKRKDFRFIFPVHPNPIISKIVNQHLGDLQNVVLTDPLVYRDFLFLLSRCKFVLTDSGGIQEEALTLGKRILIAREDTERQEGVSHGLAELVDLTSSDLSQTIIREIEKASFSNSEKTTNPYGDGRSSQKIRDALVSFLTQH